MLKATLEKRVETMGETIKRGRATDEKNRELLSEFLGSFEDTSVYSHRVERSVKTLDWGQIFFKMGKVMESSQNFKSVENMTQKIESLEQNVADHEQIINSKELGDKNLCPNH